MSAGEIRIRATKLGFAWRVREETLMVDAEPTLKRDGAGHIICHLAGNEWVCENFADATSFGMAFESHACNIIVKNGVVDHAWLYMD